MVKSEPPVKHQVCMPKQAFAHQLCGVDLGLKQMDVADECKTQENSRGLSIGAWDGREV